MDGGVEAIGGDAILRREEANPGRTAGAVLLAAGAALLALAVSGLVEDIGWIAQPFYAWAWWGWILLLDGACRLRRGHSLLSRMGRGLPAFLIWSTTFWFFFELLNVRFRNWYYVGVPKVRDETEALLAAVFAVACFSTVFTGLFETSDALSAFGFFRGWRGKARSFPPAVSYGVQLLGAVLLALSLLSPRYLSPLVWGSLTFIIDPWNYRRGARSVLRDIERGEYGVLARLLAAGLICGLVWEGFNYFAPQKWIYTVRGLEDLKLFEMPLLGFLGFPALALDAVAVHSFLSWAFHGNAGWEHPADRGYALSPRPRPPAWALAALLPLHIAFWGGVDLLVAGVNIGSFEVELADLPSLGADDRAALEAMGVRRPRQLLGAAEDPRRRGDLLVALGGSGGRLAAVVEEARLLTFKGIGRENAELLRRAGVRRIEDLRGRDPEALHRELLAAGPRQGILAPPRLEMVRVWVLAARTGAHGP